uniref:DUF1833 family protein n=1 Tax=Stappia sp. TaxID=1870903 RepID=UPI003BA98BB0
MPSNVLISAANAAQTDEVFLVLLEIDHPQLTEPVRLVSNTEDVVSNGDTYVGFPFEISLFNEDDQTPRAQIRVQNVDRRIGEVVRSLRSVASVAVSVVLASDPDTIELDWIQAELRDVEGDAISVSATIAGQDYTTEPWPVTRATSDILPGLFLR